MFLRRVRERYAVHATSIEDVLQAALKGEYQQWDMYTVYKSMLTGPMRDGIAEHFDEHADDELEHIETLQRHLIGRGVKPTLERLEIPEADSLRGLTWSAIVTLQVQYEQDAVTMYTNILKVLDDEALRVDIENILSKEQEHLQDLKVILE